MTGPKPIPTFGTRLAEVDYVLRPSSYALFANSVGWLGLVRTPKGIFLPGGGQDAGETASQAAVREVLEECGLEIEVTHSLGMCDQLAYSPQEGGFLKRSSFFQATILRAGGSGEDDHHLEWISPEIAVRELTLGSHRWAVGRMVG